LALVPSLMNSDRDISPALILTRTVFVQTAKWKCQGLETFAHVGEVMATQFSMQDESEILTGGRAPCGRGEEVGSQLSEDWFPAKKRVVSEDSPR